MQYRPSPMLQLAYLIHQVERGVSRHLNQQLKNACTLSYSQLIFLATTQYLEAPCQADVAGFLNQSAAAIAKQRRWAIDRSYLETSAGYDFRTCMLALTPRGIIALENARRSADEALRDLAPAGTIIQNEMRTLRQLAIKLRQRDFPAHLL